MMLPDSSCAMPQVAFAIGRPVGTAVTRNRIRRRMRELLRQTPMTPGLYLFGITRDATAEPSFLELSRAIQRLAPRLAPVPASGVTG
jgi:ribonuclease P protein component